MHLSVSRQIVFPVYAPTHGGVTRGSSRRDCVKFQTWTQITRWTGNDVALVIDVTVDFALVEVCPSNPGRWQCESADREPFVRSQYRFAFTGAHPDDPDEPPLTPHEVAALRRWFAAAHDQATEHAADYLRGDGP